MGLKANPCTPRISDQNRVHAMPVSTWVPDMQQLGSSHHIALHQAGNQPTNQPSLFARRLLGSHHTGLLDDAPLRLGDRVGISLDGRVSLGDRGSSLRCHKGLQCPQMPSNAPKCPQMHAFKCCKRLPIASTLAARAVHLCCQNTLDQNGVSLHAMSRSGQLLVALLGSVDEEVVLLPTWGHHRSQFRPEELRMSGIVDV